jgi:hypothetical protein
MIFGAAWLGYEIGRYEKDSVYDNLTFLIEQERNIEIIQNIKALEGLKEDKNEVIVEFMQVRVKAALKQKGIEEKTIGRAKEYQKKYCDDSCLGIK